MAKRTSTIQATIKDAQKLVKKQKKPRTSTIDETVATAAQGFKAKKKATKTHCSGPEKYFLVYDGHG